MIHKAFLSTWAPESITMCVFSRHCQDNPALGIPCTDAPLTGPHPHTVIPYTHFPLRATLRWWLSRGGTSSGACQKRKLHTLVDFQNWVNEGSTPIVDLQKSKFPSRLKKNHSSSGASLAPTFCWWRVGGKQKKMRGTGVSTPFWAQMAMNAE